ncbi:helix-turn-helix transcriptional regulator [Bradyrhizobium sp.]|uniref:helix-turn-helix transcriptional regulator n=1 Tax=Bradyrhizobium sp. TaxID=376 RepID=UPI003C530702
MAKWDIGAIERAFIEAALDSSRWNAAMEIVAKVTSSRGAALFPMRGRLSLMPHSESCSEGFDVYLRDGWIERDQRYRAIPAARRKGVASEFDFITPEEIARNPYYQEFLAPLGFRWGAMGLISAPDDQWILTLQHSIAQGPFQQEELDQLAKLAPRLSSAASVASAIGFSAAGAATEAFELSGTAVVQLDRGSQVIQLNKRAEKLLGVGLRVINKRLVADQREATNALERALYALLWGSSGRSLLPPVPLPRPGRRPLLAYPLSLSNLVENPFANCRALVALIDLEQNDKAPDALLRSLFGLTAAEAKLASRLATGEAIEQAADRLGIAKDTARNQLKSIFQKADAHRQSQLVALLAQVQLLKTTR